MTKYNLYFVGTKQLPLPSEEHSYLTDHGNYATTRFSDGTESSNWVPDSEEYKGIVASLGFPTTPEGLYDYMWEHEAVHTYLPMREYGRASYVLWHSAHNKPCNLMAARCEEKMIYYFQSYVHGKISCPDPNWVAYAKDFRSLMGYHHDNP